MGTLYCPVLYTSLAGACKGHKQDQDMCVCVWGYVPCTTYVLGRRVSSSTHVVCMHAFEAVELYHLLLHCMLQCNSSSRSSSSCTSALLLGAAPGPF